MKAKYILEAIEAMKAAEKHLSKYPKNPSEHYKASWAIHDAIMDARVQLAVYSRLGDCEIKVETETA